MWPYNVCSSVCKQTARKDAVDDSLSSTHLLTPAVLWRYALHPNEWEETHLGVSGLRQESPIWAPNYWWVSAAYAFYTCDYGPSEIYKHFCYWFFFWSTSHFLMCMIIYIQKLLFFL